MIETLGDIIEQLADELGVYGSHAEKHPDGQCECRVCWTSQLKARINQAVWIQRKLETPNEQLDRLAKIITDSSMSAQEFSDALSGPEGDAIADRKRGRK